MRDLIDRIGGGLLDRAKAILQERWDSITAEDKAAIARLLARAAELQVQSLLGQDVSGHRDRVTAALSQWTATALGSSDIARVQARDAIMGALKDVGEGLGSLLRGVAGGLVP